MKDLLLYDQYMIVPQLIDPKRATELHTLFEKESVNFGTDDQSPGAPSYYNFLPFLELLCEKTPVVSQLIDETVLPTYTYARLYSKGAILNRHKDRPACEISLTLNLHSDPVWPIWVKNSKDEEVAVTLQPGDAMLYLGCIAEHWREPFTGNQCSQVFLHYVRSRGPCAWAYFDKRQ